MRFRSRPPAFLALLAVLALPAAAPAGEPSDVMKVKRPKGGEYLGLYLMGQKVGYVFQDVDYVAGKADRVVGRSETYFRATVGGKVAERRIQETRVYEAKPKGRLVSFLVEQTGDGGDQRLEATATQAGLTVVRKRPGYPNQILQLAPSGEKVEDADQVRVALLRGKRVEGTITDSQDLQAYQVTTTPGGASERIVGGVRVKLRSATTLSKKEKVPIEVFVAESGDTIEMNLGNAMVARAEPESVAKRLDQVELFGLTRVVLPRMLKSSELSIPGAVALVVSGLPQKFQVDTARQTFKPLPRGKILVTIRAPAPEPKKRKPLPLRDPHGGIYLATSIVVESDNADIRAQAKQIVGGEKDAYAAATKIVRWVYRTVEKGYGRSSDRATDVLRTKRGDCTEHSLLAVSLMRAMGIPAKRVDGLVYMVSEDKVPAYYWHEWVEAYVGEWIQMDPTFGQDVADAGHFAVGEEGNAEIVPLIGQLKVEEVR